MVTHAFSAPSVGRLLPLCQEEVSRAVRRQQLSEVWTVDYAQDLLLLGGLLPETVWLAYHLGDWKTAASLSLAYKNYCTDHFDFTQLRRRELHLPKVLEPEGIFQLELECLLGNKSDSEEYSDKDADKSFTGLLDLTNKITTTHTEPFDFNLLSVLTRFARPNGRRRLGLVTGFHTGDSEGLSHGRSKCYIFTLVFLAGNSQRPVFWPACLGAWWTVSAISTSLLPSAVP